MRGAEVLVIAGTGAVGAGVGFALRVFLARLRRGVILRPGPTELGAGLVAGLTVAFDWGRPVLALALLAGLLLVGLAGVDLVHHRLPDAITLPALPIAAIAVGVTYLLAPTSGSPLRAVGSAVVLWALFAVASRVSAASMGGGDVKLIPTLGLLMGYVSINSVALGLALAFVLGSVVSLAGIAVGRLKLKSAIPLGPYLLLGCWVVLLIRV